MTHVPNTRQPRRVSRSAPWLLGIAVLLLPSQLHAQASGGGVRHSNGKGGTLNTAPGRGAMTKGAEVDPWLDVLDPPVFKPLCSLSATQLDSTSCVGAIQCGPVTVPCGDYPAGLAVASAGVGLRNSGGGSIRLTDTEPDARVVMAMLVMAEVSGTEAPHQRVVYFEDHSVDTSQLFQTPAPCWYGLDENDEQIGHLTVYAADVTPLIPDQRLNGLYRIEVPYAEDLDQKSPWPGALGVEPAPEPTSRLLLEGASLIVVYETASAARKSMVYLHRGELMLDRSAFIRHELDPPLPEGINELRVDTILADVQHSRPDEAVLPYRLWVFDDDISWLATEPNVPRNLQILHGPSLPGLPDRLGKSIIDRSTPNGADGGPTLQLWQTLRARLDPQRAGLTAGTDRYHRLYETLLDPYDEEDEEIFDCAVPVIHTLSTVAPVLD